VEDPGQSGEGDLERLPGAEPVLGIGEAVRCDRAQLTCAPADPVVSMAAARAKPTRPSAVHLLMSRAFFSADQIEPPRS
jgi:hypothetical protein